MATTDGKLASPATVPAVLSPGVVGVATSSAPQSVTRFVYLDNLRVLLTVLVVLHHAALSYCDVGEWYYQERGADPVSAVVFTFFLAVNQSFFMGFFFFLSGYFVPTSLARKGTAHFLRDRFVRLGGPLIVFAFFIHPTLMQLGQGAPWEPGRGPMWFVETLLCLTLGYAMIRSLLPSNRQIQWNFARTVVFALSLGVATFIARGFFPVGEWLAFPMLQPAHAVQYVALFCVGIAASGTDITDGLTLHLVQRWRWLMTGATALALVAFAAVGPPDPQSTVASPLLGGWNWPSLVISLWEQILGLGIILNLLRQFRDSCDRTTPYLTAAAASAYAVYILHPLVLVILAMGLRDWPLPALAKFLLIAPLSVAVLFGAAHLLRRLPVLRLVL